MVYGAAGNGSCFSSAGCIFLFGTKMIPVETNRTKWTEADFESLSWHDCTIHSLGLDQDGKYQSDLLIDLDFLLEWLLTASGIIEFRVAPALLRFHGVDQLVIRTLMQPLQG
jgi:hypothetical protein